ncbi:carboxypeptidase-like regulatory domain-containing protein [Winogradskyella ursingii]|uniref:carboxypeptidase-like regulatory domain-containing protein n=1 Tax=Winogradskyella ursingii TaxID=2686079 RepID=UPI0015CB6A40|nr:carboxypeptidase-like regulatory domain-containing protein [Winogradskyella ursingii]
MEINRVFFYFFIVPFFGFAQTFSGTVIDKATQQPIETASVYFDNTTIGTTTNEKGEFSITYSDAVQSTLVISYLGYQKVFINDYRIKNNVIIALVEAANTLDAVYLDYDDGLTRKQKLKLFRKEFLGSSRFAKSCKILNEEDLILRYNRQNKALYASALKPIIVENNALQYEVAFEILEYEASYYQANPETNVFNIKALTYFGTSFFKDTNIEHKKRFFKNREKAYKGSVQHFMRSLFYQNLKAEGYHVFSGKFRVNEWDYFKVIETENRDSKIVTLKKEVSILFNKKMQSKIELKIPEFYVDIYGNYSPILGVYFSGDLGMQRVGDMLPSNYGLDIEQ